MWVLVTGIDEIPPSEREGAVARFSRVAGLPDGAARPFVGRTGRPVPESLAEAVAEADRTVRLFVADEGDTARAYEVATEGEAAAAIRKQRGALSDHLVRLEGGRFKVGVVGQMNAGKSTLLNALSNSARDSAAVWRWART